MIPDKQRALCLYACALALMSKHFESSQEQEMQCIYHLTLTMAFLTVDETLNLLAHILKATKLASE